MVSPDVPVPKVAPDERVYAIGDLHGRHDLLLKLIDRIAEDRARSPSGRRNIIVFLGDYIDRGDQSRDVLETLVRWPHDPACEVDFLMGNHEAALLAFLHDPVRARDWLRWGGEQTLASFGVQPPGTRATSAELVAARDAFLPEISPYLAFLRGLRSHRRSGDVIFAHAGLKPGVPLSRQQPDHMIWSHPDFPCENPLPGCRIVHGHFDAVDPISLPGRLCVDTGAYYSGVLTAARLDDAEVLLRVDALDLI